MNFLNFVKREYSIHSTFLTRLWTSSDRFLLKLLKFNIYVEFLAPSRYLASNTWAPTLAPFVTVLYLFALRSPNVSFWFKLFIFYHFALLLEGSFIHFVVRFFPNTKSRLDTFLYGADMTEAFLGNPGSQTVRTPARVGISALGASGIWAGEEFAATANVTDEMTKYKSLNPDSPSISLQDFQERIDHKVKSYPVHAASETFDISVSMKKTGQGFAASGF